MKPHNKHAAANIKTGGYGEDTKLDLLNAIENERTQNNIHHNGVGAIRVESNGGRSSRNSLNIPSR